VATGVAIVLVSSNLPEVLNLSHRLYVMHRSRMAAELTGADISEPAVLSHFFREQQAAGVATNALATNAPRRTRSIDWNGNERQIDQR
jgi:ribose transport system ATP-binding protein